MELDKNTLADLSIFNKGGDFSIFEHLNYTHTTGGKDQLRRLFKNPLKSVSAIQNRQETLHFILENIDRWPGKINNGSVMVIEKFLAPTAESIPLDNGPLAGLHGLYYRLFMYEAYSVIRYSIDHLFTFLQSMDELVHLFSEEELPDLFEKQIKNAKGLLSRKEIRSFLKVRSRGKLSISKTMQYGHFLKYRHGGSIEKLLEIYYRLDAWYSMALAGRRLDFSFPELVEDEEPVLQLDQLFHPLLEEPVAYDVKLNEHTNFLFLTGANMAGKSTFIKAIGVAVYLAHLGMGVPAKRMHLTLFEGILSNIQVQDNIFKGESYFYNEVQRIKKTVLKINNRKKWLILIDELFKGTNFQDAKQCSEMVIEGLLKMKSNLFVLSTHLYEIAESLEVHENIAFRYFETAVENEEPKYSYQLRNGISNDRLGFLILKREKVLDLLKEIDKK